MAAGAPPGLAGAPPGAAAPPAGLLGAPPPAPPPGAPAPPLPHAVSSRRERVRSVATACRIYPSFPRAGGSRRIRERRERAGLVLECSDRPGGRQRAIASPDGERKREDVLTP